MNYFPIHHIICNGSDGLEGIIQFLIFLVFIVAMVIKSVINVSKEQQKKSTPVKQGKSVPVKSQMPSVSKERVEQFLESILQPKRVSKDTKTAQQKSFQQKQPRMPVPVPTRPVATVGAQSAKKKPETSSKPRFIVQSPGKSAIDSSLGSSILDLPTIDTNLEQLPEFKDKAINKLESQKRKGKSKKVTYVEDLSGSIPSFSDTDELKRAIIYSEILGKPISIRESSRTIY